MTNLSKQHLDFISLQCAIEDDTDNGFVQGHHYSHEDIPAQADVAVGMAVRYAKRLWNSDNGASITIITIGSISRIHNVESIYDTSILIAENIVNRKGVIVWMNVR